MLNGKILGGILFGAAVGSLLGVLFAPDKGSETRKKYKKKGEDLIEEIKNDFDDVFFKKDPKRTNRRPDVNYYSE